MGKARKGCLEQAAFSESPRRRELNNKGALEADDAIRRERTRGERGKNSFCQDHRRCHRRRSMIQPLPLLFSSRSVGGWPSTLLLPVYLGVVLSLLGYFGGVEGNSEIESCVLQTRSSSSPGGASSSSSIISGGSGSNGLGYYSGSSFHSGGGVGGSSGAGASGSSSGGGGPHNGLLGGGNVVINNNEQSSVADPHSVVSCHIRTLHPDLDVQNLTSSISLGSSAASPLDVSTIRKLRLICNDVLFFESAVRPGQLRDLRDLHELTIDKCKLTHLPSEFLKGLRHLRTLTIQTKNSDWAGRSLELSPGIFEDVPALRNLNLGFGGIYSVPEGALCKLGSLQLLNMTHDLLSDIDDLGLPGRPTLGSVKNLAEYDVQSSSSSSGDPASSTSTAGGLSCLAELKTLDLSSNNLRNLGSRRLEHLKRLQELHLQNNWLEEIEEESLFGLGQLKQLNLSCNRLVILTPKLFQPCKLLREIDVHNNSLTALSPGLFNGLEHLLVLDLSMNLLSSQWITADAFQGLVRLVILNLGNNQLTHLSGSTFHDLYTLQVLDLSNNLISSIEDGAFAPMKNLHSLNLAKNRLVTINSNVFNGLYVLNKLILDFNQITTIQPLAMRNLTSLEDLGLVGNLIGPEIPEALQGLQLLRTLDIGDNKIASLNNQSFLSMGQLIGLRLVDNQLTEIPKGLCDPVPRLRVLNVAQNKISKISSTAFLSCPELRVLRLDSNNLEVIPPTLAPQSTNLLWLNISENRIKRADFTILPATLEWLDASHNLIDSLVGPWSNYNNAAAASSTTGNGSYGSTNGASRGLHGLSSHGTHHHHQHTPPFTDHPNARLRVVDISHNSLTHLNANLIPPNIEVLRVSYNKLHRIDPDTFSKASNLRRVEIIGNQLESIPLNALRLPPPTTPGKANSLPEFFLGGNPFLCDCEMEWLTRINQLGALRQHPIILDLDAIVCRVAYSRTVTHIPLPDIKPQDFVCPYKSHCFALCHCCEFDACDCEMSCPSNCTCYHDAAWSSANIVECSNRAFTQVPAKIPMDVTEIYLDGNRIPELGSHIFIGKKNLRSLYLNGSMIEVIKNKTFNGLKSLEVMRLNGNKLRVLHGFEFEHLSRLRELYLQNNLIETISNATFLPLKSLEILNLSGNRLVVFTVWQLSLNPYLVEIGLARNPWNCDCQFLHQLYGWVTDNSRKVVDLVQLQCVWNTTHKPGPHLIDYNRTCGSSWALMGIENGFDFTTLSPLPLALAFVSLVTLLILVVALVILCRENLSLWLFTRFNGFRLCAASGYEDDKSCHNSDAYVIYSQKDEEFVAMRIADELETNDNYRLCLHFRDLICETGDLKEMMIGAVENSRSVLIILSRNFLQGEWSSGEYRSAFHAVLKKSQRGGGHGLSGGNKVPPKKILIVFIEDIPKVEINPDIRSWVRHNKIQVIKWNIHSTDYGKNRKFWNKLKFSLPDPSSHYHSNITSNTTTTSASSGEGHGGIMATLKYSTTVQGDPHLHHSLTQSHNGHAIIQHPHLHHHHHPHQQIIVDESGRFATLMTGTAAPSSATNTLNSTKYWPYGATNFVALPPKYQQSHHSSVGGSHPPSVNSPGSTQSLHYHPPLPLSNPPKSPPSSQSTDSTTTTMADEAPSLMSQLAMASFQAMSNAGAQQPPQQSNSLSSSKSPVPVPKLAYSSRNTSLVNQLHGSSPSNSSSTSNNSASSNSSTTSNNVSHNGGSGVGGESYLSLDGEHVYSTLDPPSPQPLQQTMSLNQTMLSSNPGVTPVSFLNNIHLPNGYTYQPQSSLNHHTPPHQQQQSSWHPGNSQPHHHHPSSSSHQPGGGGKHHPVMSSFVGTGSPSSTSANNGPKGFKQKDGNPVQTYLV